MPSLASPARSAKLLACSSVAILFSAALAVAQDDCSVAVTVFDGTNGPFTNVGATTSSPSWPCALGGNDVWYVYTASCTGSLTAATCGADYDTCIEVFDGTGGCSGLLSLGCNDDAISGPCASTLQSSVTVPVLGSGTYYIRVGGFGSATGSFPLEVTCVIPNDECSGGIQVVGGANGPFDSSGATTSAPAWPCGSGGRDAWHTYVASCNGTVTIDTCGSALDTVLEVFCGDCNNLTSIGCNDDACGQQSSLSFAASMGLTYHVRVGGSSGATGSYGLNITCAPDVIANENCGGALPILDGANGPFSNVGSSTSMPWPCVGGGNDVWFRYVATCCGDVTFDTCGSSFDTVLEVFTDSCGCLGASASLGCNDDTCGLQSSVTTQAVTGFSYLVRVGGVSGSAGNFGINVSCVASAPANDDCAGAVPVTLGVNGPFNSYCSTTSSPWPCAFGGNDVWYSFQANCTAPHTFRTCGADYDTAIEVFDGAAGCGGASLGCNDDANSGPCAFSLRSSLTVNLTSGITCFVRVGGFNGARGNFPLEIVTGNGNGSITMNAASLCTVPGLDLDITGDPAIGGSVTTNLVGNTGLGFIVLTFGPPSTPFVTCPCVIYTQGYVFTNSITVNVPCDVGFINLLIRAQGADVLGNPAACNEFGVATAFTDIYEILIR